MPCYLSFNEEKTTSAEEAMSTPVTIDFLIRVTQLLSPGQIAQPLELVQAVETQTSSAHRTYRVVGTNPARSKIPNAPAELSESTLSSARS